jgi:ABC-type arginine transport system ATPase subunit
MSGTELIRPMFWPHITVPRKFPVECNEDWASRCRCSKWPSRNGRRVREAARILDLDDALLDRKPKQLLSGGQRQRVAMGRAPPRAAFGDSVVLTGAGTMGLLLLQLLVHAGPGRSWSWTGWTAGSRWPASLAPHRPRPA